MKVTPLPEVDGARPRRVAIGTFDGVHLGHREVIRGMDTVLTFDPHPLAVIHPEALPKLVTPFTVKRDLIAGLDVEELVVIPFDQDFAARSAEEFVEHVLVGQLSATQVSVGENFRFGQGRAGARPSSSTPTTSSRRAWCRWSRWRARPSPRATSAASWPPARWRRPRSSSAARSCSRARWWRATASAASSACRPPTSSPTTAWSAPATASTPPGPTATRRRSTSGCRPTFETGRGLLVETYLIDFDGDLYGQTLRIAFVERMRGEKRFDSVDALVEQMKRDVEQARQVLAATSPGG